MDTFSFIVILNIVFFIILLISKNVFLSLTFASITLFILVYLNKDKKISDTNKASVPIFESFSSVENRHYLYTVASLVLFILLEGFIGFNAALMAGFLLFSHLNHFESRAAFVVAFVLLILTAFLSISHSIKAAESTAILTYYFLVVGTIWLTIEVKKSNL